MKKIELNIPDMCSAHCQARVNGAIAAIDGFRIEKLEAGRLSVSIESDEVKEELIETIEKTGYKVDRDLEKGSDAPAGCCTN